MLVDSSHERGRENVKIIGIVGFTDIFIYQSFAKFFFF